VPAGEILPLLGGAPRTRHLLLVAEETALGRLMSRPAVVMIDGGAGAAPFAGAPWPNPTTAGVSFTLEVPDGATARWRIYDVRGRLLREESRAAGHHLVGWDGRDRDGRRAPAGVYFVKVTGATAERTHKVVLLR
jgi:flagellar hook assembly protein FlgD